MPASRHPALDLPVDGRNLRPGTLGDQLHAAPVLLVFLRHFGCLFCREVVRDVRREHERPGFPRVLFVHQGDAAGGDDFFGRYWPDAPAVADPAAALYRAFDVERGNVAQMFGPRSTACAVRALAKGNGVGRKVGDGWTLPTMLLFDGDGRVVWEHRGRHAGDHHVWDAVRAAVPAPA
jgi:hypothetical protein